jgi:flagellar hook-length control protein FliK
VSGFTSKSLVEGAENAEEAAASAEDAGVGNPDQANAAAQESRLARGGQQGGARGGGAGLGSGSTPGGAPVSPGDTSQSEPAPATFPAFLAADSVNSTTFVMPLAAEATTTTTAAPQLAPQVVKAVSLAWTNQVGEAQLRLTPEHLGQVTVSLRVEAGAVSAVLQADTAAAREWIRSHESELRQGLESQGLHLDSLVVTDEGGGQRREDQSQPESRPRRQVPAGSLGTEAPRFEVEA